MKLIIAGSRGFNDYELLKDKIQKITQNQNIECIISGEARGADSLGERYAQEFNMPLLKFKPNWDLYGKGSGYRRNVEMAENATHLIAFWDGESKGTNHMIQIMSKMCKPFRVIKKSN